MRNCPICFHEKSDFLHKQEFIILGKKTKFSYTVVACKNCGFLFASNISSQKQYEQFYKTNVKYAYQISKSELPEYAIALHDASFQFIDSRLKKFYPKLNKCAIAILDIGCASGNQLHCFKKEGYADLLGIDPAPECKAIAKNLYGVKVVTTPLSGYTPNKKFNVILFGSVLEHLYDVHGSISQAHSLLKDDGLIFVSVPDVDHFGVIGKEPFLEFSLEHINYFTRNSLMNIFGEIGFEIVSFHSLPVPLYGGYALNSLWRKVSKKRKLKYDTTGKLKIKQYIRQSSDKLKPIKKVIQKLVETQKETIVWGTGSLTSRLLAMTDLTKVNIICFVDSNIRLHGKKLIGEKICSPDILKNKEYTIFVSSYIHQKNIAQTLKDTYHYKGEIILL